MDPQKIKNLEDAAVAKIILREVHYHVNIRKGIVPTKLKEKIADFFYEI